MKCLIVVDYQVDFVVGALGFYKAVALEDKIAEKISEYRASGGEIIFTFDTHRDNYMQTQEGRKLPIPHCIDGTEGHKLYGRIAAAKSNADKCIYKHTFGSDELMDYLRGRHYDSIELVGVVSNICVLSNAIIAKTALPEVPVIVDAACTASNDDSLHNAAMDVMQELQINVINR